MDLSMFSLEGKVALVTGASTGLGMAMSIALANAGANICGVASKGEFNNISKAVKKTGQRFHGSKADLLKMESISKIVKETCEHFGRIDILVNNAGIERKNIFLKFSEKDWDDVINLNVKIPFFLTQEVVKVFEEQKNGGKIINICSLLSFQGGLYSHSYTASKSALLGITRSIANELASNNINVNAIAPGYIKTRLNDVLRDDPKLYKEFLARIPAGHFGDPQDLNGLVVFLASSASNYCNGSIYPVDGSWLAR